jgi:hypothetical protein
MFVYQKINLLPHETSLRLELAITYYLEIISLVLCRLAMDRSHRKEKLPPDQSSLFLPFHALHWHSVSQPHSSVTGISCCPKKNKKRRETQNHLRHQRNKASSLTLNQCGHCEAEVLLENYI